MNRKQITLNLMKQFSFLYFHLLKMAMEMNQVLKKVQLFPNRVKKD